MLKFMKASHYGRKTLALLMSVVLAMLILPAIPAQAATDSYEVGDYKGEKTQEEWTYPTQDGKVFAGWYADAEFTEVYEETTGTAYAKFVDANVLDLKKQLSAGVSSISEKVSIRFLTGIDTLHYSNVTFHVSIPDENKTWEWVEDTAYSSILVDGEKYPHTAADVFGEGAAYFVLHSLTGIPSTVFDKQFVASVSWTTLDGTVVNTGDKTFTIHELIESLDSDVYVINTANELLAFNSLCTTDNDYFKGKTVKLGADITLNEGNAADWASGTADAPNNIWTPVNFGGTFDGQGHTVRGLYVNSDNQYTGLFSTVLSGATVKNLKLTDSYIEGNGPENRSGVGSIAGRSHGTIDTVYTNAILKNSKQMTGGIVGMITEAGGENEITNCWFDGTIYAINGTGGILGCSYGQTAAIEHCLNTGVLNVTSGSQVGGLCGYIQGLANVTISDSLNAGTLTAADGVTQMGTIVGAVANTATLNLTKVYGVQEFKENVIGWISMGTLTDNGYAVRALDDIKGYGAYQWTKLDFDGGTWGLKDGAVPVLGAFGSTDLSLEEAKALPDFSWYDETADTYVISTARQLLGFNSLCNADTDCFADKTVKLGGDITLTGGSETTPNWTPITFSGIFDGQGHSVSGVYVKTDKQYNGFFHTVNSGATVKNLKLVNSHIEGNGSATRSGVGSIAGRNYGTIDTVYSSATVKNSKQMTGGIVGMSFGGTISNCWFDGTIYGVKATGGILGGTYDNTALITHCLNTGTIIDGYNSSKALLGGLCGYAQNSSTNTSSVTIRDCLSAGMLESRSISQIGAIVGGATKAMTIGNVYGATDTGFGEKNYGWTGVTPVVEADSVVKIDTLANLYGTGAAQLDYDNYWTVREGKLPMLTSFEAWADSLGK